MHGRSKRTVSFQQYHFTVSFIMHVVTAEFEKFESFDNFKQKVDEFLGTFLQEKICQTWPVFC